MSEKIYRKSTAVAQDRYRKQTWEHDQRQATEGYAKAALSGAAIGALARKKMPLGKATAAGAGAGILAQAVVRHTTGKTKDQFGDRSHAGKRVDQALPLAGEVGAAVLGYRKLSGLKGKLAGMKLPVHFSVLESGSALDGLGAKLRKIDWGRVGRSTAVGAGALGAAGAVSGALVPDGDSRVKSSASNAVKDGIFGGALYGITEPLLKKSLLKNGTALLSAKLRLITFRIPLRGSTDGLPHHSEHEARTKAGTFEPYEKSYYTGNKDRTGKTVGWSHPGFVKAQWRQAQKIQKHVRRGAALGGDLVGAARGEAKVDSRGRTLKREWQKTWVKNAAGAAVGLAGIAVAKHTLKRNPAMRADLGRAWAGLKGENVRPHNPLLKKAVGVRNAAMDKVSDITSGRTGSKLKEKWSKMTDWDKHFQANGAVMALAKKLDLVRFDIHAGMAGWDLRDPRGRSARVFAPGAKSRDRREKKWHERVDNIRRIGIASTVGAGVLGVAGGMMIAKRNPKIIRQVVKGTRKITKDVRNIIVPFPHAVGMSAKSGSPARTRLVELGIHTLKSGKMTGQVVRWGKDLPAKMPTGWTGKAAGTMHVSDPATQASMVVQRGRDKLAQETDKWWTGRKAYIANINIPKEQRKTITGGKSLKKLTDGVFDHLDRRGISATTMAGAYEKRTSESRIAGTHKLVQSYQKQRGFRIDPNVPFVPNEWNTPMTRKPNAPPVKPISRQKFDGSMEKQRARHYENAKTVLQWHLSPLIPGVGTVAGTAALGGATAVAANTKGEHRESAKNVLVPGMVGVGAAVGSVKGKQVFDHLRKNAGEISDYGHVWVNQGRVSAGKSLSKSGGARRFLGKQLLRGVI